MNPTAGSFTINPLLQHHFSTSALGILSVYLVKQILSSMLYGHIDHFGFNSSVRNIAPKCIETMISIQREISAKFMQTAIHFHCIFNMRGLCQLLQGLLRAFPNYLKTAESMARLLSTEAILVYADLLINLDDYQKAKNRISTRW